MYGQKTLSNILGFEYRSKGYELGEQEDLVFLLFKGQQVASFSAMGATAQSIRKEADNHWNQLNSGIEFCRA